MFRKYFAVTLSGLVLFVTTIFMIMNIGDTHTCNAFNIFNQTHKDVRIDLIMVCSAIGGVILWYFLKIFCRNGWGIYREKRKIQKQQKQTQGVDVPSNDSPDTKSGTNTEDTGTESVQKETAADTGIADKSSDTDNSTSDADTTTK